MRHNDDCTPACVPLGDADPEQRRVCSKGCNILVKAERTTTQSSDATDIDAQKFELVVCQADKVVVCPASASGQKECTSEKEVKPVALCSFSNALWNLGGTCIANHVHGDEFPQCPDASVPGVQLALAAIDTQCRMPKDVDEVCGGGTDMENEECKDAVKEREYCTRLAMSY